MARAIAEKIDIDKSNASRRLKRAADDGYIRNLEDQRGKPGRWVLGDPLPDGVELLPEPALLASGCAVQHVHGEKERDDEHGESRVIELFDGSAIVVDEAEII